MVHILSLLFSSLLAIVSVYGAPAAKTPVRFSLFAHDPKHPAIDGKHINACDDFFYINAPYCNATFVNGSEYHLSTLFFKPKGNSGDLANNYRSEPYYVQSNSALAYSGYFVGPHAQKGKFEVKVPGLFTYSDTTDGDWMACSAKKYPKGSYRIFARTPGKHFPEGGPGVLGGCFPIKITTKKETHEGAFEY